MRPAGSGHECGRGSAALAPGLAYVSTLRAAQVVDGLYRLTIPGHRPASRALQVLPAARKAPRHSASNWLTRRAKPGFANAFLPSCVTSPSTLKRKPTAAGFAYHPLSLSRPGADFM